MWVRVQSAGSFDQIGRGWVVGDSRFFSFFLSFQSSFYLPLAHVTDSHLD